jgi:carbamoyl-phosphate synthase large subunit
VKKLTIAISGMNAVDSPGPGVPVVRSLLESSLDTSLIGLVYDVLEPGSFMPNLLSASFMLPYPNSGAQVLLARLLEIHKRFPLDLIIPTLDAELDNYLLIQDSLREQGIRLYLPGKEQLKFRDKTKLSESLKDSRVLTPTTIVMGDPSAILNAGELLTYPFLIKGLFYEAYLASNYEQAVGYFYKVSARWGFPVIAQQWIRGEEYNVVALAESGKVRGAVAMKKMFLTDKGKAWAGVTIDNQKLMEDSKAIIKTIDWNGGCELEYIVENKTNKQYLLEINPRFPAWIYLATAAGQNLPEMLVRLALEEKIETKTSFEVGKVFVRHSWDDIVDMKDIASLSGRGELILEK